MHTGSGLGRKAATLVCEFEKLAFVYFALVSLTSVHKIHKKGLKHIVRKDADEDAPRETILILALP